MDQNLTMEQRIRQTMEFQRHPEKDNIEDWMGLQLVSCDTEKREYIARAHTAGWMRNAVGHVHGGISTAFLDQAMGCVCHCQKESAEIAPTIEMNLSFHRPVLTDSTILLKIQVVSVTRHLIRMAGQIVMEDAPDKVCVSATATFYCR